MTEDTEFEIVLCDFGFAKDFKSSDAESYT